jgi:predicted outer membrane repeat protein
MGNMNFKVFFFAVFMCCLVFCGNPQYIYALDNLPSIDDCRSNFTNGMNRLESDSNFARDLFNHKVCYVNPDRDNSFMDWGNVSSPAQYSALKTLQGVALSAGNVSSPVQYLASDSSLDQYSNLKDAVKYSKPGDTIFLKPGNYSGENNTNITINHDLNIIGLSPVPERVNNTNDTSLDDLINSTNDTGIIIDGKGENSFFNILGSCTVTLGNLTLINARSSGDGAAICNSGKLLIDTSFIKNNVVKSDRFADKDAMGGAIYNSGDLSLDYVTCEGNNATGYSRGGAIFNTGTMNINNSAFCNNSAGSGGGAIYSISTLGSMYFNCFFAYNKAGSESGESGGAIYNEGDGLSVVLSTFVNNTGDNGGAIDIFNSVLSLEYSDFVFNNAWGDGGAVRIRNGKQQSVQDCNFVNNTGSNGAGLYYSDGEKLSIDGGSFTENRAVNDGGGISLKKGELSLNRTSVTHNTCFGRGGGIYNYDSDVVLNNLSVMFNVGSSGAGLYTSGEGKRSVDLMYGVFSDNFALGDGGAVYADTNSRFHSCHGVFSANHAENGGGIYSRNNLVIDDGGFINNTCSGDGAGLNLQGDKNSITGSLFSDNEAAGSGGGIYNGGGVDCHDCLLYNNSAGVDGGALFIGGGCSSFYHDQFESNRCGGYGGAVFSDVSSSFPELMNDFRGNVAGKDGDDFITASDKAVKANAGIIGYAISAFLIAVVATVATIASCGAAGPASLTGAAAFFANLGIGLAWGLVASVMTNLFLCID